MKKDVRPSKKLQNKVFQTMLTIIIMVMLIIVSISLFINIHDEKKSIDENLLNIAETVAHSADVRSYFEEGDIHMQESLDTLKASLINIDVISVIGNDGQREYHSNKQLIHTRYDGTFPNFTKNKVYVTSDVGPSGNQRRAYAQIVGANGEQLGFVLAVMLDKNISQIINRTIFLYGVSALLITLVAFIASRQLALYIKKQLQGYEPDTFSQMFSVRESILESLDEGIVAVDLSENVLFINASGKKMLGLDENWKGGKFSDIHERCNVKKIYENHENIIGRTIQFANGNDIVMNGFPVEEDGNINGALCVLHDRTEFTKIMEELSGVKYLVESMRANNHDFVNKLHVILGLIQMGENEKAAEYISNVTSIQQTHIHNIMENIDDPSIAALLIGKYVRATELNIHFSLQPNSKYHRDDVNILQGDLVTIIGNLLDNAMDSLNEKDSALKELSIGLFTQAGVLLIMVDDTGNGMSEEVKKHIFENHYSTKGEGRGTGLYIVSQLVAKYNGSISVETVEHEGTAFEVELTTERRLDV